MSAGIECLITPQPHLLSILELGPRILKLAQQNGAFGNATQ